MNYKNVAKKKKKNTAIIVIASILACVLAGGAIAGLGFHFNWWNVEKEAEGPKPIPTSTFNLEIGNIEDLCGVEFKYDDYTFKMSTYKMSKEELLNYGVIDSLEDEVSFKGESLSSILNVDPYGVKFELPESGQYEVTMKINGEEYISKLFAVSEVDTESDRLQLLMTGYLVFDKNGKQIELEFNNELETQLGEANHIVNFVLFDAVMIDIDHELEGVEGYSLFIQNMVQEGDGFAIDTFEFVRFERIGDIPEGMN